MDIEEKILNELVDIKKLLILQLVSSGNGATEIGKALGLTSQRISQLVSIRRVKKGKKQ